MGKHGKTTGGEELGKPSLAILPEATQDMTRWPSNHISLPLPGDRFHSGTVVLGVVFILPKITGDLGTL